MDEIISYILLLTLTYERTRGLAKSDGRYEWVTQGIGDSKESELQLRLDNDDDYDDTCLICIISKFQF